MFPEHSGIGGQEIQSGIYVTCATREVELVALLQSPRLLTTRTSSPIHRMPPHMIILIIGNVCGCSKTGRLLVEEVDYTRTGQEHYAKGVFPSGTSLIELERFRKGTSIGHSPTADPSRVIPQMNK